MSVDLEKIPQVCGVYIIKDRYDNIIYIGKSRNLKKRVNSYFDNKILNFKVSNIRLLASKIEYITADSEREALIIERRLINEFKPFFNVLWKDSKTYPSVVITKEDFPRILIVRNKSIKGDFYGPYPKVEIIRRLIERLEYFKIINLRKCNYAFSRKKKLDKKLIDRCIYYHTLQCPSPCDEKRISRDEYMEYVKNAKRVFSGNYRGVVEFFEKKMKEASDKFDFESAIVYRDAINGLNHILERVSVDEKNLNDIISKADFTKTLIGIKEKLNLNKIPYHIESFDISNLFNKYAVGGMVCFINGKKNHQHYRRYKIKYTPLRSGGDDYAMMYEVVKRRLTEAKEKNEIIDLIIIDGGKGQLLKAIKAVRELKLNIDVISIAKEKEGIYTLTTSDMILLEKDSPELLFLTSIRDETHRFALSYHRMLRSKEFML